MIILSNNLLNERNTIMKTVTFILLGILVILPWTVSAMEKKWQWQGSDGVLHTNPCSDVFPETRNDTDNNYVKAKSLGFEDYLMMNDVLRKMQCETKQKLQKTLFILGGFGEEYKFDRRENGLYIFKATPTNIMATLPFVAIVAEPGDSIPEYYSLPSLHAKSGNALWYTYYQLIDIVTVKKNNRIQEFAPVFKLVKDKWMKSQQ